MNNLDESLTAMVKLNNPSTTYPYNQSSMTRHTNNSARFQSNDIK